MSTREPKEPAIKERQTASLSESFRPCFDIGAAVNSRTIESQRDLLRTHYNSLTAENEMKFESVHPEEHRYTFEAADAIAEFARQNGKKLRGHTLVWHNQTPDWVFRPEGNGTGTGANGDMAGRETLLARMKSHIETVVGRYKGTVYCWDVVNEAVADEGEDWLRPTNWLRGIGESYLDHAFRFAHEADPGALLFYNDYNECRPEKREKIHRLVKGLLEREVPIHGIGLQGHYNLNDPSLDEIRAAIERYASLGLQLQITELDLSVFDFDDRRTDLLRPDAALMERQADRYQHLFRLLREYKDVFTAVTFWGGADDYTWLDDFPVRGRKNWPMLFDEEQQPKPAFWRVITQP